MGQDPVKVDSGHHKIVLENDEVHLKAGQVTSSAPVKHEAENIGDKPIELVQVERKTKPAGQSRQRNNHGITSDTGSPTRGVIRGNSAPGG